MKTVIGRCAGLDVHQATMVACVRIVEGDGELQEQVGTFTTTTSGLITLCDWLSSFGITTVGTEIFKRVGTGGLIGAL